MARPISHERRSTERLCMLDTACVLAYASGIRLAGGGLFRWRSIRRRAPAISAQYARAFIKGHAYLTNMISFQKVRAQPMGTPFSNVTLGFCDSFKTNVTFFDKSPFNGSMSSLQLLEAVSGDFISPHPKGWKLDRTNFSRTGEFVI